jgi:hypothetical protein
VGNVDNVEITYAKGCEHIRGWIEHWTLEAACRKADRANHAPRESSKQKDV